MTECDVIDISHWQPQVSFPLVKEAGVVGVILKATEGKSNIDPTFRNRTDAALSAGLEVSSYHFMRPGSSIQEQMGHYLKVVGPRVGERVCLDHEDVAVSLAYLEDCVAYLLGDSRKLQITIYSGHVIKDQLANHGRSNILAKNTSLWLAQYSTKPSWPKETWPHWTLWQFSDKGMVDGVKGNCDVNHFNGTKDSCISWLKPSVELPTIGTTAPPQPGVPDVPTAPNPLVEIDLKVPKGIDVQVSINGKHAMSAKSS